MANLVDTFGRAHRYLRISVTDRCGFRCVYCMPPEGIPWREREEILTYEEIVRLARLFASMGVDKIRLTGGEPTVRKGLETLIGDLARIPGVRSLLMTTNGTTVAAKAGTYRRAGLTGMNVSLDTLRPGRFLEITRRDRYQDVMDGIAAAIAEGFTPLKLNVVVMAGINDDELVEFVDHFRDQPVNVRFIEFMPFDGNGWSKGGLVPYREMRERIESAYRLSPIDSGPNAVAKDFAIEGREATVSFVTSMTESFCAGCNRIRLTAEGNVKACLFGPEEFPLRDRLRAGATDEEISATIREAVTRKAAGHAPAEILARIKNRSMIQIGG
ncbi:MAG TPA: GTP 3',8-cyclase MoaA [Fimbriimonas sp.]